MNHATNHYNYPPPYTPPYPQPYAEQVTFLLPSLFKLSQLCRHGMEGAFYMLVLHVFFAGIVRFFPSFDASGDFALASRRMSWRIGVAASFFTIPIGLLYHVLPFVLRYKECIAAGNFGPANELRRRMGPGSMSPAKRRWAVHALVVLAFIAGAYIVRSGTEKRVIDPFHAGVLGVCARVMFCAVRWFLLGDKEEVPLLPSDYYFSWKVNL